MRLTCRVEVLFNHFMGIKIAEGGWVANKTSVDFLSYILSLLGATATIIVFAFMNFQTSADAEKDRRYQDEKLVFIQENLSDVKSSIRDVNLKLDKIIESKLHR